MTFWRSSRLFADTRTASPWICGLTFGNSSRISLDSFLASSSFNPRRSVITWRTLLPPAGSTFPQSKIFSDRLRRIAFDSMRSLTAPARYSSSVTRTSSSLACVRSTVTPLKSYRCPTSRRTWSSALRSSCSSKSLTTSKEMSPAMGLLSDVAAARGRRAGLPQCGARILCRPSAVREGLEQDLPDPIAPTAAHDEDGVPAADLPGEPRGGCLDRSGRSDRDPRVPLRHRLRQARGGGDRGVAIPPGPDVRDRDAIGSRQHLSEVVQQRGGPMERQRLVNRPDPAVGRALPDSREGLADRCRVVPVVVEHNDAADLALALQSPADTGERWDRGRDRRRRDTGGDGGTDDAQGIRGVVAAGRREADDDGPTELVQPVDLDRCSVGVQAHDPGEERGRRPGGRRVLLADPAGEAADPR